MTKPKEKPMKDGRSILEIDKAIEEEVNTTISKMDRNFECHNNIHDCEEVDCNNKT